MMPKASSKNVETPCYICDQKVQGDGTVLSTAVASVSKLGLPEKISQVIGDQFTVVVTENDIVCKRCISLLSHMDKLENELMTVKKAILTYLKQKYRLPVDETSIPVKKDDNLLNEIKLESTPESPQKSVVSSKTPTQPSAVTPRKDVKQPFKEMPNKTKPPQTPEVTAAPKVKIYKCGFCSYQSKELSSVRIHMKQHAKSSSNKTAVNDSTLIAKPPNTSVTSSKPPSTPVPAKRRVYRCQVCSASFDDKTKCMEHISLEHTQKKKTEEKRTLPNLEEKDKSNGKQQSADGINDTSNAAANDELSDHEMKDLTATEEKSSTGSNGTSTEKAKTASEKDDNLATTSADSKTMHAIDIEAMIASLHSDGPTDSSNS